MGKYLKKTQRKKRSPIETAFDNNVPIFAQHLLIALLVSVSYASRAKSKKTYDNRLSKRI